MGKRSRATRDKRKKAASKPAQKVARLKMIQFGLKNYLLGGAGLLFIILGFVSLAKGSITLAPILLVLGYCVVIPVAILIK
jgi:hypothetical protein